MALYDDTAIIKSMWKQSILRYSLVVIGLS